MRLTWHSSALIPGLILGVRSSDHIRGCALGGSGGGADDPTVVGALLRRILQGLISGLFWLAIRLMWARAAAPNSSSSFAWNSANCEKQLFYKILYNSLIQIGSSVFDLQVGPTNVVGSTSFLNKYSFWWTYFKVSNLSINNMYTYLYILGKITKHVNTHTKDICGYNR